MNQISSALQTLRTRPRRLLCAAGLLQALLCINPLPAQAQAASADIGTSGATMGGPVRLRQPAQADDRSQSDTAQRQEALRRQDDAATDRMAKEVVKRSDFEVYVGKLTGGQEVRRFGSDLLTGLQTSGDAADYNPLVPPDYLLRAGDELVVTLWGSVDADLRLRVDRSGRISVPRVGPVMVSGVRYADLNDVISRRVAQVFKNFQLSASLGQLRGQRVYVTGFVNKPGALSVSSLSTLAQALMRAGGPSAAGSFRDIQLRRGRSVAARFDLYDLLLKGDRSADQLLQADDVIQVGPVGAQVALIGSVNRPAIFEAKPGETVADVLHMAGGFTAVADNRRLSLEHLDASSINHVSQLDLPAALGQTLASGDVLRAFNAADVARPTAQQTHRVRVEGEVAHPGEYLLPPDGTVADALRAAGGTTTSAYLYATELDRESVRTLQQENYDRVLRDFETQLTKNSATQRISNADDAATKAAGDAASGRLLAQMRNLKPSGRIVLQLQADSTALPDLVLEDGDRLYIPPRPTTVGVFGSVFSTGSYLYSANRNLGDYLRLAGGPTKGADDTSVFVVRANGSVASSLQQAGFFSRGNQIANLNVEPGDTIFVPEEVNKATFLQNTRDWTQVFFQIAVGLAGLKTATGF